MEIICSSSALFNPASRDFASRDLGFSKLWQFRSEEVTAVMVGERTFGLGGQKWSSSAYNGPSSTLTLNNPFGEVRLGDLLLCSVLSNANIPSQVSRHRNVSRSQGNVAWIVPTMVN